MNEPMTPVRQPSIQFFKELHADALAEEGLLPKQVIVVATIGLLLLLRQLVLA